MDFTLRELREYKAAVRRVKDTYIKRYGKHASKWFGV